jgi:hypothetical protein
MADTTAGQDEESFECGPKNLLAYNLDMSELTMRLSSDACALVSRVWQNK